MKIFHFSAELAPLAKVGGLADVVHGLSRATLAAGHQATVVLPKYDQLPLSSLQALKRVAAFDSTTIWTATADSIPLLLVDDPGLFRRGKIYGCEDDPYRFTLFCLAALEYLDRSDTIPDILHLHDWHTALAAPLCKTRYSRWNTRILFTIHNFAYQGWCDGAVLDRVGWKSPTIGQGSHYNLMKGGILYADHITTVSPQYAKELLASGDRESLQETLRSCQQKFSGILNGIDYDYWNPAHDPLLPAHFSPNDLSGKEKVKKELRQRLSLKNEERPLVTAITRLVPQKSPALLKAALLHTLTLGGQFVLLGSPGDLETEKEFREVQTSLAGSGQAHIELSYNEESAHLIFGGSDLFLVPSLFEPCGLTQLIAMRYGALPLVRETGGLLDTVRDGKNGFSFGPPTIPAVEDTVSRALALWNSTQWSDMRQYSMKENYSWEKPTKKYLDIYKTL